MASLKWEKTKTGPWEWTQTSFGGNEKDPEYKMLVSRDLPGAKNPYQMRNISGKYGIGDIVDLPNNAPVLNRNQLNWITNRQPPPMQRNPGWSAGLDPEFAGGALVPRLASQLATNATRREAARNIDAAMTGAYASGMLLGNPAGALLNVSDQPQQSAFAGVNDTGLNVLNTAQQWQRRGQAMANGGQAQGGMMDSENWFSGTPSTERYYRRQYARQIDDRTRGGNPMARLFLRSGRTSVSPLDATPSGRAARGGYY